jgi:hypothetical protein
VIPLWANPEFIRNCRAQLRPRRLVLVASVIAALSLVVGYSTCQAYPIRSHWGTTFFSVALYAQMFTLCLGGGYACLRSIAQEREQNTFDFQRVTQLTSLELALGKLFGAPAISYFAVMCMFPAALVGAVAGGIPASRLAAAYVILFTGSVAVHALLLVVSLGTSKTTGGFGGALAMVLLFLLLMLSSTPEPTRLFLDLGPIGPAAAANFAQKGTWEVQTWPGSRTGHPFPLSNWTDMFFGMPVHHVPVLILLYVTFILWCLVPLVRNLKRDPALLELYSPAQSVGLFAYLNVILVGFFALRRFYGDVLPPDYFSGGSHEHTLSEVFNFFLIADLLLLYCLGLTLLHNREQTRRRAHHRRVTGLDWQEAAWPAANLLAGAACAAVLFLVRFARAGVAANDLNARFAVFTCALLLATTLRDLCFLQWMNLRRSKRPLLLGVVLVSVFYTCGGILLGMANFSEPVRVVFTSVVLPWPLAPAGATEQAAWSLNPTPWFIGLAFQVALVTLFAALHYKSAEELRPAAAAPANAVATGD